MSHRWKQYGKKKTTVKDTTGFTVYYKNMILFWLENKTGKMAFGK